MVALIRTFALVSSLCLSVVLAAQWEVPVKLVFDGASSSERQITGLADPVAPDAAVSLDAARATAMTFATAQGSNILTAQLSPAPSSYSVGMTITVVPDQANMAGAQLDLNGLGPLPIVKWGGVPLDSADLRTGDAVRLMCDGSRFHLIGHDTFRCPPGFSPKGRAYCIADSASVPGTFFEAAANCANRNSRLCTFQEWAFACRSTPGFLGTISQEEWVDHAANNAGNAKLIGMGSTGDGNLPNDFVNPSCDRGTHNLPTTIRPYRCCFSR